MSRDTILERGRAVVAEGPGLSGAFIDACTVTRTVPGSVQTDPLTGAVASQLQLIYTGACRVQQAAAPWAGPATVAQAEIGLSALEIQLPVVGTGEITKNDIVTITACVHDAGLVGRKFTVQGAHRKSHATTRRLPLQEVLS